MRKIFLLALIFVSLSVTLYAQKDITRFLDIPIDGYKTEMIKKLKDKGYTSNTLEKDVLEGEFNGREVNIHIVTNNNKVWRISVFEVTAVPEEDIKRRFNELCKQFKNNEKYAQLHVSDYTISDDEDISYMMSEKNKQYEASFYQRSIYEPEILGKQSENYILKNYTKEQQSKLTEDELTDIKIKYMFSRIEKKLVWFMIYKNYGKYNIAIYYDNVYNKANGEDL
jgi:hypothetical protein